MTYGRKYTPEQFDLRDCRWEFLSVKDDTMTVNVNDVNILSGENQGDVIETALVTFHGFHLSWIERIEDDKRVRISVGEGPALLTREPYFVFSYWNKHLECEMAGFAAEFFAMRFTYHSADLTWDRFKERPVGTLTRTE